MDEFGHDYDSEPKLTVPRNTFITLMVVLCVLCAVVGGFVGNATTAEHYYREWIACPDGHEYVKASGKEFCLDAGAPVARPWERR